MNWLQDPNDVAPVKPTDACAFKACWSNGDDIYCGARVCLLRFCPFDFQS